MVELSLFSAVVTQSYLLILQGIASISCLILSFLLEPKWSQAVKSEPAEICLNKLAGRMPIALKYGIETLSEPYGDDSIRHRGL